MSLPLDSGALANNNMIVHSDICLHGPRINPPLMKVIMLEHLLGDTRGGRNAAVELYDIVQAN